MVSPVSNELIIVEELTDGVLRLFLIVSHSIPGRSLTHN